MNNFIAMKSTMFYIPWNTNCQIRSKRNDLNIPIHFKEIQFAVKTHLKRKLGPDVFTGEFYRIYPIWITATGKHDDKVDFIPGMQVLFTTPKISQCYSSLNMKNCIIILINAGGKMYIDKVQHLLLNKNS